MSALGRPVDRPAFDQPSGVKTRYAGLVRKAGRERPAGARAGQLTEPGRLDDQRVALGKDQLSAAQPADLRVRLPGREQLVHAVQLGEGGGHRALHLRAGEVRAAQVDADRQPHDLLDPGAPTHRLAWSIADWSDSR